MPASLKRACVAEMLRAYIRRSLYAITSSTYTLPLPGSPPATVYRRFSDLEPPTLRALLLLVYGTGLRRGEALGLSVADVSLPDGLLTIRDGKFFKTRLVPIGRHLTEVLNDYVRWRTAAHPSAGAGSFF